MCVECMLLHIECVFLTHVWLHVGVFLVVCCLHVYCMFNVFGSMLNACLLRVECVLL